MLQLQLWKTLSCIKNLLHDAEKLKSKYGLAYVTSDESNDPAAAPLDKEQPVVSWSLDSHLEIEIGSPRNTGVVIPAYAPLGLDAIRGSGRALRRRRKWGVSRFLPSRFRNHQEGDLSPSIISKMAWAIEDCNKFIGLVRHLKDLIDDLEDLTKGTNVAQQQRIIVDHEIEAVDDLEELQYIEEARQGEDDVVSDAASARLERLTLYTASVSNATTFITARTHISSISSRLDEVERWPDMLPQDGESLTQLKVALCIGELSVDQRSALHAKWKPHGTIVKCETEEPIPIFSLRNPNRRGKRDKFSIICYARTQEQWDAIVEKKFSEHKIMVGIYVQLSSNQEYDLARTKWAPLLNLHWPHAKRYLLVLTSKEEAQDLKAHPASPSISELRNLAKSVSAGRIYVYNFSFGGYSFFKIHV
ncbi:hypothetical protein BU23DRAFT_635606 [Bimuria novae-zelandiae CBS 107.79]|uniref:Prion-inhibition and propagation HeLo domain-containing protein n=1 Tax=Bimuria novae-zelandiae CBS 107.79 TaxID=1447943 RepID=A0A6A5VN85_9PLEO|nr:hypothetical protein BU23DRAFT_635606 [Bimuria novae-zelandiae CBS 107.79]